MCFTQDAVPAEIETTVPPRHDEILVSYDVVVPMRDKARLFADVYRPEGIDKPLPTILIRVPYGKQEPYIFMPAYGRFWARRGFAFVAQDVRGKFASSRDAPNFVHSVHEVEDAYDTLKWIVAQPWSDGAVGLMGESYMGYTALAAVASGHPAVRCISPGYTAVDWAITDTRQGALMLAASGGWLLDMDAGEYQNLDNVDYWDLPLADIGRNAGIRDGMYIDFLKNDLRATSKADLRPLLKDVNIPMLHFAGAYDNLLEGNLHLWDMMQTQPGARQQWLVFGPWDHENTTNQTHKIGRKHIGESSAAVANDTVFEFFEYCLKGIESDLATGPRVRYFTIGENRWRQAETWPPEQVTIREFYLASGGNANTAAGDGKLLATAPEGSPTDHFVYDPADPVTISLGKSPWSAAQEMPDHSALEDRRDVLFYVTKPLKSELNVTGPVTLVLYASTSAVDTDFATALLDVDPEGNVHRVQTGMIRASFREGMQQRTLIEPDRVYEYTIDMLATSYLFERGHRLRVEISSSDFNHFARNLNHGEPIGFSDRIVKAKQTVHHSERHPSRLVLSVIE
jgi:putative CocE/NonD family hydrolase